MDIRFDGDKLRALRDAAGWSHEVMAQNIFAKQKVRVSSAAICQWEHHNREPKYRYVAAIAKMFNKPVQYFFTRKCNVNCEV